MKSVKFKLSESQLKKLATAHKNGTTVTLRLNKNMIAGDGIPLTLTATEYKKIQKGNTYDISISATRVKQGGFLPALMAALPIIGSVLAGVGGVTGIAKNIKEMVKGRGQGKTPNITPILKKGVGISLSPN
jgi:hypothetical protein